MGIDEIIQPAGDADELLLADTIVGGEGDDSQSSGEAIDEIEYPDTLDDDVDPATDTPLIRQMREKAKQDARDKRELARQIEELRGKAAPVHLPKPTLETCEWDEDKLADELLAWRDNERLADEAERAPVDPVRQRQAQEWSQDLQAYQAKAAKLIATKPDFKASEDAVVAALSDAQQQVIVMVAKHPERFIDALGRSPGKLAQLAEITNPLKLAGEIARIEGARIMARKEPANIDTPLRGNGQLSSAPKDEAANKLLAAAEKDPSKFEEYRAARKASEAKAA